MDTSPEPLRRTLAVVVLSLLATGVQAANLRAVDDAKTVMSVFEKTARIRLLNVWATWCVPCVAEMPDLKAIDDAFGSEVGMGGISLDDMVPGAKREKVTAFLDQRGIAFPNLYYTGNADKLGDRLRFTGEIPITIIYDRHGKELWRHQGRIDRKETIAKLRDLLRRNP